MVDASPFSLAMAATRSFAQAWGSAAARSSANRSSTVDIAHNSSYLAVRLAVGYVALDKFTHKLFSHGFRAVRFLQPVGQAQGDVVTAALYSVLIGPLHEPRPGRWRSSDNFLRPRLPRPRLRLFQPDIWLKQF